MIIVIDGADGVGKSTTIQGLLAKLPNSTAICPKFDHKRCPTFEASLTFEFKKLEIAKELGTLYSYVLVDRSIFTTIIYDHIFSNHTWSVLDIERHLQRYKQLVDLTVFLYADHHDIIAERIIKRSKVKKIDATYEQDATKQKQVNQSFQDMFVFVPTKVLKYATDKKKATTIVNKILTELS
jgi:thymidylate kinase